MGNWTITVKGIGQHHNNEPSFDADGIALRFVKELLSAGQNVEKAEFVHQSGDSEITDDLLGESNRN